MTCKGIARTDLYKELGEKFSYEEKADLMNLSKYINSTGVGNFGHNLQQKGNFYWNWGHCSFISVCWFNLVQWCYLFYLGTRILLNWCIRGMFRGHCSKLVQTKIIDASIITVEFVLTNQNLSIQKSLIIKMVHLKSHPMCSGSINYTPICRKLNPDYTQVNLARFR